MGKKSIFVYILSACILVSSSCGKNKETIITIKGSMTMEPLIVKSVDIYKKNNPTKFIIHTKGSLNGLTSLIDGKCDIAISSIKIPAPLLFEAQKKGVQLKEIFVGYDIIIPIIHPSNTITNLFLGQLSDIYTGLLKDWKDAEGSKGKIEPVDRNEFSGTRFLMYERFFEAKKSSVKNIIKNSNNQIVSYIAQHPGGVGYISKVFLTKQVKALNINGFSATDDNITKKYYPLCREIYLYVKEPSYKDAIKTFIDFIVSKEGQAIIKKAGYKPLSFMDASIK